MTTRAEPVRRLGWTRERQRLAEHKQRVHAGQDVERLVSREWLVTNGMGGYASGSIAGVTTRRYHGLLIAALPAPLGRTVMLNHLSEEVRLRDGRVALLGGEERVGPVLQIHGAPHLTEFRLELGLPVWRYEIDNTVIEKRILLPYGQNTVHVLYYLLEGAGPVRLKLRPAVHFRPYEAPVSLPLEHPYVLKAVGDSLELSAQESFPPLRMCLHGERKAFTIEGRRLVELLYRIEQSRGYEPAGDLWCPGFFRADLNKDEPVALIASTESWQEISGLLPQNTLETERERRRNLIRLAQPATRDPIAGELLLAADQFIIVPAGRVEEAARAHAAGENARTVIAGYHWFNDWGRDTMISLEGLALSTGRHHEASYILRTFGRHVRDGLIPNMFPDGATEGLYHTADATLWFFHAIDRYVAVTGDRTALRVLLPKLRDIVEHHVRGTRFGIGVDPNDGLLRQGADGYQLTWMDAKCDGWVITPRRGKAVEINALWYNALRVIEQYVSEEEGEQAAREFHERAEQAYASFNSRFWYEQGGHLYDVVDGPDGDDPACRPNQVFAISLPHAILAPERWSSVLDVVRARLLTPVGLRSLSPDHPDYKPNYHGDLRTRDAAYHQGTVWAWLIGPFIDAWLKVHPDTKTEARGWLNGLIDHLDEFGVGTVAEVFDAEQPYTPRGCIAQAWSVAELLRCWLKTQ